MSSPILSNIFQNNTEILKEQHCEMQRRHKKEQQLQACLEKAAEVCHIEYAAQKTRKAAEAKAREEAEKWKIAEKKKKKKKMEYL